MPGKRAQTSYSPRTQQQQMVAPQPTDYSWQDCEDFQVPHNSVWFGKDDDGSDIYCGKAYCEGQEVPAKIIPEKRECRVRCDSGEKTVPHCRKVLICSRSSDDDCHRRRKHCHRRTRCHSSSSCSSSGDSEHEEESHTKTTTNSSNECRVFVKSVKSNSNSTTTIVKKNKKNRHKKHGRRGHRHECWDEQRTRVVPRVTYEPRVRYEPKVTMERRVRYETENYTTRVCADRCRDRCREDSCEPCDDRRDRRCREAVICERRSSSCSQERCIRPSRCSPAPSNGGC